MVHGAPKPEKVVHCNVCQREFQSARACSTHMAQIHGPGKFKCKLCKEVLQTLDERYVDVVIGLVCKYVGCFFFGLTLSCVYQDRQRGT